MFTFRTLISRYQIIEALTESNRSDDHREEQNAWAESASSVYNGLLCRSFALSTAISNSYLKYAMAKPDILSEDSCKANVTMKLHSRVSNFFLRKLLRFRSRKSPKSPTGEASIQPEKNLSYSQPLENAFPTPKNSFTIIPCRVHLYDDTAQVTVERFYQETAAMQIVNDNCRRGSSLAHHLSSPIGHCVSFFFPQCLPKRLETVTMLLEISAIHDSTLNPRSIAIDWTITHSTVDAIERDSNDYSVKDDPRSIKDAVRSTTKCSMRRDIIQNFICGKLSEIVETFGKEGQALVQNIHAGWVDMGAVESEKRPLTFEKYLVQRGRGFGLQALWATTAFSLGVLLTPEESKLVQPLVDIANRIIIQTTDYFSWGVERGREEGHISNSIIHLMKEHRISEDAAIERLKISIIHDERAYLSTLNAFHKTQQNLPNHLQTYTAAVTFLVGGNHHWCAARLRYKPLVGTDENQVLEPSIKTEAAGDISMPNGVNIADQCKSGSVSTAHSADETADLDDTALLAPPRYIQSLASKNFRLKLIDALNVWFKLPEDAVDVVKTVVNDLHNSTLLLDDIEDESALRRGSPAAHCVFGPAQCINSATYMVVQASTRLHRYCRNLSEYQPLGDFLEALADLSLGQSWDLNWKFNSYCPSTAEYMTMIDGKTGALFKLIIRLMQSIAPLTCPTMDLNRLAQLLGRWFQVRDDYQNLQDSKYTEQKGFCEDLDEGKLSYPVVLCCDLDPTAGKIILGIFRKKEKGKPLAHNVKIQVLNLIRNSGALEKAWKVVQQLEREAEDALSTIEAAMGEPNASLRLAMKLLGNTSPPSGP